MRGKKTLGDNDIAETGQSFKCTDRIPQQILLETIKGSMNHPTPKQAHFLCETSVKSIAPSLTQAWELSETAGMWTFG
jgi:hypothetical protein